MSESAAMAEHGPVTRGAAIQGLIDNVQPGRLFGWAWNRSAPTERLRIELRLGDQVVAEAIADNDRPDLASGQIGDGRHAFDLPLTPEILARRAEIIIIARAENGEELALPIRAVRRAPTGLTAVPTAGTPGTSPTPATQTLPELVRTLSSDQIQTRRELAVLAERMPGDGALASASALADLQSRIETLELRCLTADEQLAALHGKEESRRSDLTRRLDPWQVALLLLVGLAAGGALVWSLSGVTPLIFGR